MGRPENMEKLLEDAKLRHLSEVTLVSYRDNQLDKIGVALADSHLTRCLICQRRLSFLKEEELESNAMTELEPQKRGGDIQSEIKRLQDYLRDLRDAWVRPFSAVPVRGAGDGDEIWRHTSEDGLLTAWAVLEKDASLTVHFSSTELAWEGMRIRFRLGPFSKEVTLKRKGDDTVAAKIKIPRHERAKKMSDVSIEIV
jgi:hypothetical protein